MLQHIFSELTTVIYGDFEWDQAKAAANLARHGISFEEAATAIVDPLAVFLSDDATGDERAIAIGMSERARILLVVHVERGERDRIISARCATSTEESLYEQGG